MRDTIIISVRYTLYIHRRRKVTIKEEGREGGRQRGRGKIEKHKRKNYHSLLPSCFIIMITQEEISQHSVIPLFIREPYLFQGGIVGSEVNDSRPNEKEGNREAVKG